MPRFLEPKKSTQHRVAAIALYRALLSRCSTAPLPDDDRDSLRNAIRNKFRKNRKIQSPYQLGLSFRAGYEVLDHLDASATDDTTSAKFLTDVIPTLPRGLTRPLRLRPPPPPPSPPKERLACLPPDQAVLNVRPYANVSGPRHVPILASANGIPFLRITKPQPPALSRMLRQKLERRINNFHRKVELTHYWMPIGKQEDEWDSLINLQLKQSEDNVKWVDAIQLADRENQEAYEKDMANDKEIVKKMQKIVDKEMELALKEGRTIVRGRKKRPIRVITPDK